MATQINQPREAKGEGSREGEGSVEARVACNAGENKPRESLKPVATANGQYRNPTPHAMERGGRGERRRKGQDGEKREQDYT